jgi:hypothetical protein
LLIAAAPGMGSPSSVRRGMFSFERHFLPRYGLPFGVPVPCLATKRQPVHAIKNTRKKGRILRGRGPCFILVPKRRLGTLQISTLWQYVDFI